MIPIIVKKSKDPDPPPARGSTYYVYAANGIFQVKRTPMYDVCAKVDHEVPGMEHQQPYMRPKFSMVPSDVMDQVMSFFRRVLADLSGEAIVELYYNADTQEWLAIPPVQGVSGSHKPPEEYGMCFEDLAHIEKATFTQRHAKPTTGPKKGDDINEAWADQAGYAPWGGHYMGSGYRGSSGGYGATGWHSLLYQPSAEAPPEGYFKMGTIHSHMNMSAYFSATDDADDRYGDGVHLVFGNIKENPPTLEKCVAARFMSNGTPFEWEKGQFDTLLDPFIDPDADYPKEWLKKCHLVETEYRGDTEIYVSAKSKRQKKREKREARGPLDFFSRRVDTRREVTGGDSRSDSALGNYHHCGEKVEFEDHKGETHIGKIASVVFHRGNEVSYSIISSTTKRTIGGIHQDRVRKPS